MQLWKVLLTLRISRRSTSTTPPPADLNGGGQGRGEAEASVAGQCLQGGTHGDTSLQGVALLCFGRQGAARAWPGRSAGPAGPGRSQGNAGPQQRAATQPPPQQCCSTSFIFMRVSVQLPGRGGAGLGGAFGWDLSTPGAVRYLAPPYAGLISSPPRPTEIPGPSGSSCASRLCAAALNSATPRPPAVATSQPADPPMRRAHLQDGQGTSARSEHTPHDQGRTVGGGCKQGARVRARPEGRQPILREPREPQPPACLPRAG